LLQKTLIQVVLQTVEVNTKEEEEEEGVLRRSG
jgi:hypothetical protein